MKILVTGARGQLGSELSRFLELSGIETIEIDKEELDFLHPETVAERIADERADWVVNCAAYTQVDRAEEEVEAAFLINRDSAKAVAEGVRNYGGHLLHISTDFIFSGESHTPYDEAETGSPVNVYGRSKWEGEVAVRALLSNAIVLRTAWVYGNYGNNFVKTMLKLAAERSELRIVDDQIGTPTWTMDIARVILMLIERGSSGTYHFTNEGVCSWYDFSEQVVEFARQFGQPITTQRILPIPSSEYPTPAVRPHFSVLNKQKIRNELSYAIPHWRESLYQMLKKEFSERVPQA